MRSISYYCPVSHTCILGEGPLWDHINQRILWVDIFANEIHSYFIETGEHKIFNTVQKPGAIALNQNGEIIAALENGFFKIVLETGSIKEIINPKTREETRFNDGKCDPAGRFWAGTLQEPGNKPVGRLYMLMNNGTTQTMLSGLSISNGMAWAPDGNTFYFVDTATLRIAAYDFNAQTGKITNERICVQIPEKDGYPDGMTIDNEGMLWVALWDGWKIARYNPLTGKEVLSIPLPVARPTSCIFGGKDLDDIYITSATFGLDEKSLSNQPLAGKLFVIKNSGFRGLPTYICEL